jgi:outer membrane protein OmpA-like peptidoglycan-associated protein
MIKRLMTALAISPGRGKALSIAALSFAVTACVFGQDGPASAPPPPPPSAPPPAPAPVPGELDLAGAVKTVLGDLGQQIGPASGAARTVVVDPLLDGKTGQQTNGSLRVHQLVSESLPGLLPQVALIPFDAANTSQARLVASGTLTPMGEPGRYRLSLALSDRTSGIVVAQSAAMFRQDDLGSVPTRFYGDSPSLVRDRSIEGYLRTAETEKGKAADALYIEQLPTAALLSAALEAYNAERWEEALNFYNAAVQRKDGQQLRTFNGVYLANIQLGRMKEAEQAFGKIAALGLATNNLSVKLLFTPGTTDFWADPKVNSVYPMWLRQIARAARASGSCLNVVGHTSKSGTDEVNDKLSQDRASIIRTRLNQEVAGLSARLGVQGVGSHENLVGTGADDATDALDRRVEFKVVGCDAAGRPVVVAPPAPVAQPATAPPSSPKP